MQSKSGGAIAREFAGFWRRFAAFIIDGLVLGAASAIFAPFHWLGAGTSNAFDHYIWLAPLAAFISLASFIIQGAYFALLWQWRGQTLGMMAVNVQVIRTDGSDITLGYAIVRYLGYYLSAIVFFLGFIWIAFDERKQGWHDKIADTYVVKVPKPLEISHHPAPLAS